MAQKPCQTRANRAISAAIRPARPRRAQPRNPLLRQPIGRRKRQQIHQRACRRNRQTARRLQQSLASPRQPAQPQPRMAARARLNQCRANHRCRQPGRRARQPARQPHRLWCARKFPARCHRRERTKIARHRRRPPATAFRQPEQRAIGLRMGRARFGARQKSQHGRRIELLPQRRPQPAQQRAI